MPMRELEERMADEFMEYTLTEVMDKSLGSGIKHFFRSLLAKIKVWMGMKPHLNQLYKMINQGAFSNRKLKENGIRYGDSGDAMYKEYYIDIKSEEDYAVVRDNLFRRFAGKSRYGVVSHSANKWYLCDYFGDGEFKARASFDIEADADIIEKFENEIQNRTFRDTADIDRLLEELAHREGQHRDGRTNAKTRVESMGNVLVDSRQLEERDNSRAGDGQSRGDNDDVFNEDGTVKPLNTRPDLSIRSLTIEQRRGILARGYTEESWNNLPYVLKEQVLRCV